MTFKDPPKRLIVKRNTCTQHESGYDSASYWVLKNIENLSNDHGWSLRVGEIKKPWRDRGDEERFQTTWAIFKIFTVAHRLAASWWLTHHHKHLLHGTCVRRMASCKMINPNSKCKKKINKSLTLTVLWQRDKYFHLYFQGLDWSGDIRRRLKLHFSAALPLNAPVSSRGSPMLL